MLEGERDGKALSARVEAEAFEAFDRIVEIASAETKEVGARTKLAANLALLEHAQGKPTQKIISVNAHTAYSSAQEELAAINAELAEIRKAKGDVGGAEGHDAVGRVPDTECPAMPLPATNSGVSQ